MVALGANIPTNGELFAILKVTSEYSGLTCLISLIFAKQHGVLGDFIYCLLSLGCTIDSLSHAITSKSLSVNFLFSIVFLLIDVNISKNPSTEVLVPTRISKGSSSIVSLADCICCQHSSINNGSMIDTYSFTSL